MTLREILEAFKKGYTECYGSSDIKKADNHDVHTAWREELTDFETMVNGFEVYAVNKGGEDVPFKVAFNDKEVEVNNHFYGVEHWGIFYNLNSKEEFSTGKDEYLAPFKEWNPELTFKIKFF